MTTPTAAEWIAIAKSLASDAELAPLPPEDDDEDELAAE
jgi:hypothetical protein